MEKEREKALQNEAVELLREAKDFVLMAVDPEGALLIHCTMNSFILARALLSLIRHDPKVSEEMAIAILQGAFEKDDLVEAEVVEEGPEWVH